jgi:hypothetical protein
MDSTNSFVWPQGCQGAISITFDDGLKSHLETAAPRLEEREFRGTFYLNPRGENWLDRLAAWKPVQAAGHEIGNHTIAHPCSLNTTPTLQSWTLQQIEEDVCEAQRRLDLALPGGRERSFAYPCYESDVGRGPTRQSYVPVIARHFIAARAKGASVRGNHPEYADLHHLSSWGAERMSTWDLIGLVEQCLVESWWGIFTFHGVDEGHLPISEHDLCGLLDHLARHRERVWTAPLVEVARYILDHTDGDTVQPAKGASPAT